MVSEVEVKSRGVKILAGGKLEKKLTVTGLKLSAGAKKEIEKVGGKIETETRDIDVVEKIKNPKTRKKNLG